MVRLTIASTIPAVSAEQTCLLHSETPLCWLSPASLQDRGAPDR
jgi:hypothetical protein